LENAILANLLDFFTQVKFAVLQIFSRSPFTFQTKKAIALSKTKAIAFLTNMIKI